MLYVITHKSIHPYHICAALHFCPPDRNTTTLAQRLKKDPALEQKHSCKKNNYMVANEKNTKEHNASRLKLLQFNDVHLDRFYKEVSQSLVITIVVYISFNKVYIICVYFFNVLRVQPLTVVYMYAVGHGSLAM